MMEKFKTTPLQLDNSMPKELYSLIENKWHYCLNLEKQIRESTLANLFPEVKKVQITKKVQKYNNIVQPKYRAFSILQNKIEEVVQRTTQIWRIIYGLVTLKQGQEDPFKETNKEEEKKEDKEEERKEDKEEDKEEEKVEEEKEEKRVEETKEIDNEASAAK